MVDGVEISPSDRAKCNRCGKLIGKGTPRGVTYNHYGNHMEHKYYCYRCAKLQIIGEISALKQRIKDLDREVNKNKKAIILWELKNDKN